MTVEAGRTHVEEFLAHYADPNYDPAKAHEYYMENRQLKSGGRGRAAKVPKGPKGPSAQVLANRAAAATKKRQREALRTSNQQLSASKKVETANATAAQQAKLEKLRSDANAMRDRIQKGLEDRMAAIAEKANLKFEPTALIPIPSDASPKVREYLQQQNERRLAVANRQQQTAQAAANREKSAATQEARKAAMAEMHKMGSDLKAAVEKARADYASAKAQMTERYKQAAETAKANIEKNVR